MAKDPVCGMTVDSERAAATEQFEGKSYFFCSPGCRDQFKADPQRYVSAQ